MDNTDYYAGIHLGITHSCLGIYFCGEVKIIPNLFGEPIIPSKIYFEKENKILIGDEIKGNRIEYKKNNLIYELLRFIGLSYNEFLDRNLNNYFEYEVINMNGFPKIKIIFKEERLYSPEEIISLLLTKLMDRMLEYIKMTDKKKIINNYVITVPDYFSEAQINAVKFAAKLAKIENTTFAHESTVTSFVIEKYFLSKMQKYNFNRFINGHENYIIVFHFSKNYFYISLLKPIKTYNGIINDYIIINSNENSNLGGNNFINILTEYCIRQFCEKTSIKESEIKRNEISCELLRNKCETAIEFLSITNQTIININNFFKNEYLCINITNANFISLCYNLFDKMKHNISELIDKSLIQATKINKVILVGDKVKIPGLKLFLQKTFINANIYDDLNPSEIIALGAAFYCFQKNNKQVNSVWKNFTAFNLGFSLKTENEVNEGNEMFIIKKHSKIPIIREKNVTINLTKKAHEIYIDIFEGNNLHIKMNRLLGSFKMDIINTTDLVEFKIIFTINTRYILHVKIIIGSLKLEKELYLNNISIGLGNNELKRIIIFQNQSKYLFTSSNYRKNQDESLINFCENYEDIIMRFSKCRDKNNIMINEHIYNLTKGLFDIYLEMIKQKREIIRYNTKEIIQKIKNIMRVLISELKYSECLMDIFIEIRDDFKNIYYEIFVNYMELLNNFVIEKKLKKELNNSSINLYYMKSSYFNKKYIIDTDLELIERNIKDKYEKEKKIYLENFPKK